MIESREFADRHRFAPNQFVRERLLPLPKIVLFLLNLVQGALQAELDRFFEIVHGASVTSRVVTKAALSLARRKLHFGAFVEINRMVVDSFYAHREIRRWRGWRLLAIDGSTATLPGTPEVVAWFGAAEPPGQTPSAMGRVSSLYDVLNRVTVEAHLAPYRVGERDLALCHLAHLNPDDLLLFDRGYPAFWLFALLRRVAIQCCMRLTVNYSPAVQQFVASGQPEQVIEMAPGGTARRECRKRGLSLDPVAVRLVRVELTSGEVEVLATSLLDTVAYPQHIFGELYHHRWGIEEGYKAVKCRAEIENFSGKSVHSVMQDFHAKIVTTNLTALLVHQAQSEVAAPERRHPVQVNFSHAIARMKDTMVRLFTAAHPCLLLDAFIDVLRRTVEPVRPNRSFPRLKRITLQRFRTTYKRCG